MKKDIIKNMGEHSYVSYMINSIIFTKVEQNKDSMQKVDAYSII